MKERVFMLGGELDVASYPGKTGTRGEHYLMGIGNDGQLLAIVPARAPGGCRQRWKPQRSERLTSARKVTTSQRGRWRFATWQPVIPRPV
jgi:hypothetical protein